MFWKATNELGEQYAHYIKSYVLDWYTNHNGNAILEYDGNDEKGYLKYNTIVNEKGFDVRNIREDNTLIKTSVSMRKAIDKYDKENTKQIKMKLNKNTDADIIAFLESQDNIQGKLKELIRKEIKENSN